MCSFPAESYRAKRFDDLLAKVSVPQECQDTFWKELASVLAWGMAEEGSSSVIERQQVSISNWHTPLFPLWKSCCLLSRNAEV